MQSLIATHAAVLDFIDGLRRPLHLTFRRRDLLGLALRFAGAPGGTGGGIQSTEEYPVEGGEQE